MVDFKQLRDKAQGLLAEHSDSVKKGITKAGGVVGGKVGHDKVDPIEDKLRGFIDKAAGKDGDGPPPPSTPTPPPPSTPNPPPPAG